MAVTPRAARALRRPLRRLFRAYSVTVKVVLSYAVFALRRRLRSQENAELLADRIHQMNARRVLAAIVDLQGLFIKVGQLISVMANLLPAAFRKELETLQDSVPPRPFDEVELRLREELGRGPRDIFAEFDEQPVASASIGQVHVARLRSGQKVAVKVQYPDIETIVATDLRALKRISRIVAWLLPDWGWEVIYREIRKMVLAELDYRLEAEAMTAIAANFAGRSDVRIPRVIGELSTGRVLVTEWADGVKVGDVAGIAAAGIDRVKAARLCIEAYCKQIFVDGIYHADPHPGNLLLTQSAPGGDPVLVFLDFGATARISPAMRKGIVTFLQGAVTRDVGRIVAAMKEMGFISRHADHEVFDRVIQHFYERFRSQMRFQEFSTGSLSSGLDLRGQIATLLDLRQLDVSLSDLRDAFHVPREWVLLERTLLLLLGVCTTLAPELNPAEAIQPYVDRFILGERKEWSETVLETAREATLSALALPNELGRFLNVATRGDVQVRVRRFEESSEAFYALGHQLLWGFLLAVSYCVSLVYETRGQIAERRITLGLTALFALLLVGAVFRGRRARKRKR